MTSSSDPRIVLPVDPQGHEYLVFEPATQNMLTGWAIVWSRGQLFAPQNDLEQGEGQVLIRLRFGNERSEPDSETSGALIIRELYVSGGRRRDGRAVSGRSLRNIHLSRYEAAVNTRPARAQLLPLTVASLTMYPWPEMSPLSPTDDRDWWIVPPVLPDSADASGLPELKIDIPTGYGRPDRFYQQVADLYAVVATSSTRPANELAEANDVPVTTVHGWVKEARKRGFLPSRRAARSDVPKEE